MRRALVVATATAAALAVALPAWAWFTVSTGTTSTAAVAGSLGTPAAAVSGTPTPDGVTLSVGAPASGVAPLAYRVDRTAPTTKAGVCALAAPGPCTDLAPVAGQTNTYAVYALRHGWSSLTPATVSAAVPAETRSYVLTPSTTTPTAGTSFTVTITARKNGATDTTYAGTKSVTWSGGQQIGLHPPEYPALVTFANGVATATVTLYKSGAQTLVATDANVSAYTGSTTVTAGHATVQLTLTCPSSAPRGAAVSATLGRPAADAYGNATTASVAVTVSATFAQPASQAVTLGAGATTQSFTVTMSNANNRTTVLSTSAPTGYAAASPCSTAHT